MPAGNIMESHDDLTSYLEGLAKIDLQGEGLVNVLGSLIDDINLKYCPDVILIDSRTGFNNTFGALAQLSDSVVVLAGDDAQNQPGIEYVTKSLNEMNISACFILSIISANFNKRYSNFSSQIQGLTSFDAEVFYFDRQNTLEFIGTSLEDKEDLDDFISGENGSVQYQKFFKYIYEVTTPAEEVSQEVELEQFVVSNAEMSEPPIVPEVDAETTHTAFTENNQTPIQEKVLSDIKGKLPNLYAENIDYSPEYISKDFYFRPCMEDLLIPEKCVLLGDKGTGKTAFYKALKIDSFFKMLISKAQKKHLDYHVLNITNFDSDNFEFLGLDELIKDELSIKRFWMFFIWNAICS